MSVFWKAGDFLRIRCGWGMCCWKFDKNIQQDSSKACVTLLGEHECFAVALASYEEIIKDSSLEIWGHETVIPLMITSFGIGFSICTNKNRLISLFEAGVIKVV